jgi:hypothetical protein
MLPNTLPDRGLTDLLLDQTGFNTVQQAVADLHLSTVETDFGIIRAEVNNTVGALAQASSLPLLLMQAVPSLAIGLLGLNGGGAFAAGTNVLSDAFTLVVHEHGFDLIKPYLDRALATVYTDPAARDQMTAAIHRAVIDIGLLPAPNAADGTPAANPVTAMARTSDPLTRFIADGILVVMEGHGLRAVVEPITASLQKMQDIASAGAEKVSIAAGRIWDKATLVASTAGNAVAIVSAELQAPTGWGNWVPNALRSSAVSVLSGVNRIADQVQSHVDGYTRQLSAMRAAFS